MKKRKRTFAFCAAVAAAAALFGCSGQDGSSKETEDSETVALESADSDPASEIQTEAEETAEDRGTMAARPQKPEDGMEPLCYEAEAAKFVGNAFAANDSSCSGEGYADGLFKAEEDQIVFEVDVPYSYFYDLDFLATSGGQEKYNYVSVDGERIGTVGTFGSGYDDCSIERIYLEQGKHEIAITAYWGYVKVDKLTLSLGEDVDSSIYNVSSTLVNPNAEDCAKRLMSFLTDQYGKKILTGQYSANGYIGYEVYAIRTLTGYNPAVLGLDLIDYTPSRVSHGTTSQTVENAIDWWERGGVVTICWHWNAPEKYITGEWYSAFNTKSTNIDLKKIMDGEDKEGYDLLMNDIDVIAKELKRLDDAGVPILWRPLHEASGGWFWWGDSGSEAYKQLWKLLYDKLTNEYQLNNLIWVWNGQAKDWYPGDDYVDIVGEDIYPGEQVVSPQTGKFMEVLDYADTNKMVVLSENGCVFDPDLAYRDGTMWGYYCTWSGEFVLKSSALTKYSEKYTTKDALIKMYHSPAAINLEDLPDLKTYPIHE